MNVIKSLPTKTKPPAPKVYDRKAKAQNAAVAALGPHAREGFEFTTSKVDGSWVWRACDEVRPDTTAQVKINGRKSSNSTAGQHEAAEHGGAEGAASPPHPKKLPVPPRRMPRPAPEKAAGGGSGEGATQEPPKATVPPLPSLSPAAAQLGRMGVTDIAEWPSDGLRKRTPADEGIAAAKADEVRAVTLAELTATPEGQANAKSWEAIPAVRAAAKAAAARDADKQPDESDGLDIPGFLKRPPQTEEQKEAIRKKLARQVGPERVIKNPPNAKAKAVPHASDVPFVGDLSAPGRTVGKFPSKAALIKAGIAAGDDNAKIVEEVRAAFPPCQYKASDINFYRRKMG